MKKSLLLAICGLVTLACHARAQSGLSTLGTDFYAPVIFSSATCQPLEALRTRQLIVTAFCDTRVTVSYFDRTTGRETQSGTYLATPSRSAIIPLDVTAMRPAFLNGEVPEYIACHVTAEHPVSVHAFSAGPVESYGSMVLPTNLLGTKYAVASFGANTGSRNLLCKADSACSMFLVIATKDSTKVTITPTDYTLSNQHEPNKPFTVVLQRGQVYCVKSHKFEDATLDNSRIVADRPIVVWGANEAAAFGSSGISDPEEDLRNVLAQQLLPVRLWSKGPFYMCPLIDPPGIPVADPTIGNALIYYADTTAEWTHRQDDITFGTHYLNASGAFQLNNIAFATLDSTSQPIMVEALDYRAETINYPVAAPTLMNVLPWTTAVRAASFTIPSYAHAPEASSYLTIVLTSGGDLPSIHYWMDGADSGALLNRVAQYQYHNIRGWTYRLPAGHTYRITSDSAFVAYQSNFYGLALSGKVQHGGANSYFFSCATPVVGRYPAITGERPRATVAYNCDASWSITARGSKAAPLGLATVLRDPHGDYIRLASDSGYTSTNIDGTGVLLTPGDTLATFRVAVRNPLRNASAWVQVQNTLGNDTIIHLTYTAPLLTQSLDSISFDNAAVGRDSCVSIIYTNVSDRDTLHVVSVAHNDTSMHVSTVPSLPLVLLHGQSMSVTVCHTGKIESRRDTLHLQLACGEARVPIHAISAKTTMTANDRDFGAGIVGTLYPRRVAVMNTGNADLLISRVVHSGSDAFVFTDTARLPHLLEPGASTEFAILYKPNKAGADTAYLTWISNAEGTKSITRLTGRGLLGGLVWTDSLLVLSTRANSSDTIHLTNPVSTDLGGPVHVESLNITGPDAADFSVTANELGYYPLQSFPVAPQESVWFVVTFAPDTMSNTSDRHAILTANDLSNYHPQVQLLGRIGTADVVCRPVDPAICFVERDNRLECLADETGYILHCYDLLGREVVQPKAVIGNATVSFVSLVTGTYVARLVGPRNFTATHVFHVWH